MEYTFYLAISLFLLSLTLTFVIKYFALKHKIIDIPNERSSHTVPTPRGGGLAIVVSWYIGISFLFYFRAIESNLYFALLCGLILAIISILDDIFEVKPLIRLSVQILTAVFAVYFLKEINPILVSGFELESQYLLYPLAIVGIVWFVNLFNFLDGIDGYASLEAIIISLVLFVVTGNNICLVLIASIVGFLYWNWPKAKIFMGDIGSTQLGFILIVLGIYFHNRSELSIVQWIMLSSMFWFDATLTLYRRWKNKEQLTKAHKKHAYQRIVQSGFSHRKTLIASILINIIIIGLVYLTKVYAVLLLPLFAINIVFLYGITRLIDKRIPFGSV